MSKRAKGKAAAQQPVLPVERWWAMLNAAWDWYASEVASGPVVTRWRKVNRHNPEASEDSADYREAAEADAKTAAIWQALVDLREVWPSRWSGHPFVEALDRLSAALRLPGGLHWQKTLCFMPPQNAADTQWRRQFGLLYRREFLYPHDGMHDPGHNTFACLLEDWLGWDMEAAEGEERLTTLSAVENDDPAAQAEVDSSKRYYRWFIDLTDALRAVRAQLLADIPGEQIDLTRFMQVIEQGEQTNVLPSGTMSAIQAGVEQAEE